MKQKMNPPPDPTDLFGFKLANMILTETDQHLIRIVEEIEGRVPTDVEVARHCFCGVWPDGRKEYKWKGETILVSWIDCKEMKVCFQVRK